MEPLSDNLQYEVMGYDVNNLTLFTLKAVPVALLPDNL